MEVLINHPYTETGQGHLPRIFLPANLVNLSSSKSWNLCFYQQSIGIDVIYIDFSKAFDSLSHVRLLSKLEKYGIQGNILGWIKSFLSGRCQRVGVEGSISNWTSVTSGIPQGSVIEPVLFVIFINGMPSMTSSICKLFADDAKTYRLVKQHGEAEILQQDLNRLVT